MNRTISTLAALGLLLVAGCGLSRPYPNKSLYAISAGQPAANPNGASEELPVLRVESVRVAKPFDGNTFVYKVGEGKYETDYYNGFITSPDRMLTTELVDWLTKSGNFSSVIFGDTSADSHLSLECNVLSLYGDYTPGSQTSAVIEARVFLIDESSGKFDVVLDKFYRQAEPITDKSSDALVKGWDRAYARMLEQITADLRTAHTSGAITTNP